MIFNGKIVSVRYRYDTFDSGKTISSLELPNLHYNITKESQSDKKENFQTKTGY